MEPQLQLEDEEGQECSDATEGPPNIIYVAPRDLEGRLAAFK